MKKNGRITSCAGREKDPILSCLKNHKLVYLERITSRQFDLEKDQKLTLVIVPEKNIEGRPQMVFNLKGSRAELNVIILIVGKGGARYAFDLLVQHQAAGTKANVILKAAMFDESALDFSGNLVINKKADKADTYLASHALILSDKAAAKAIPALEIEADDVKAGHAATMGKIDQENLYYLMSRGLDENESGKICIEAFFESALNNIPDKKCRLLLRQKIINLLP